MDIKDLYRNSIELTGDRNTLRYGIDILSHDLITGVIKINDNTKRPTTLNPSGLTALKLIRLYFKIVNLPIEVRYCVGASRVGYDVEKCPGYTYSSEAHWIVLTPKKGPQQNV